MADPTSSVSGPTITDPRSYTSADDHSLYFVVFSKSAGCYLNVTSSALHWSYLYPSKMLPIIALGTPGTTMAVLRRAFSLTGVD